MSQASYPPSRSLPRLLVRTALALLLLSGADPLPGQTAPRTEGPPAYSIASWTVDEGVPVNTILDVLQTADGYLWLATYEGLVRFDGVRFVAMSPAAEGIEAGNIWRLYEDPAGGVLWAGATGGVVRHRDGHVAALGAERGIEGGSVRALLRDADGSLLVGTSHGVMALRDERFVPLPAPPGVDAPSVSALADDGRGGVWIGTFADGLLRWRDGRYSRLTTRDGLPSDRVQALLRDADGTLWIGTAGVGLARHRDGVLSTVPHAGPTAPLRIQEIVRDRSGTLWVGADNGLFRVRDERLEPVADRAGRPFSLITGLHADQEGSLWVSTHRAGLFHVRPASVEVLPPADAAPSDVVYALAGDGAGGVWVGARDGLTHRTPSGTTRFSRSDGALRDNVVRDLLIDRSGDLWLATFGGLARLREGRMTTWTARDGLADDLARSLLEDRDGGIWIGSFDGLSYFRDGRFRVFGERDGLVDRYVLALHQDRTGAVWISTQTAGLLRLRGGRIESPPEVAALHGAPAFRIREDPDGTLWIGSTRGLARLRGGKLARITQAHGLPSNTIFQVLEDDLGHLWLSSNRGVIRVSRADAEAVADGRAERLQAKIFGRAEGLPAHDVTAVSRAWEAPDGSLWFPTPGGIARIDPRGLSESRRPPPVHLEGLRVNGLPVSLRDGEPRLEPGVRRIDFEYTALSFMDPAQVRFRYRLEGFDEGWMDGGTQRSVSYTNLAPGRYRFRVIASNEDGVWNTEGASLAFQVRPHFHQTGWFAALAALAVLSGAAGSHRLRVRHVRRAEQDAEREASRQRLRRILESVTDSFVALDADWRMTYVNGAAEQALGQPRERLLGRSCWEAFPAAVGTRIEEELRRAVAEQVPAVFETPMSAGDGRWLEFRVYPTPEGLSVYFSDVSERKAAEEALRSLSLRDPLTALFNRRGLLARAEQQVRVARESGHGFHIVFIDMDGMKTINDTFGHAAGDRALTDVASLLRRTFRESDVLARIGGDEFAVLVLGGEGAEFDLIADRLHRAVHAHNVTMDRPYLLRLSIGSSRFDPAQPVSIEELIATADRRMYTEKRAKGGTRAAASLGPKA